MSTKFDWNAVEDKIKSVLKETKNSVSRSSALTIIAMGSILDIALDEALDAVIDGGNDRGIDGIFIDDRDNRNDVHLFQVKCVRDFEKSKNNFPSSEVDKVTAFVSDVLNADFKALKGVNPRLDIKIRDLNTSVSKSNCKIFVHFVGNMAPLVIDQLNRIKAVFQRYSAVVFEMHDLDALSDFFLAKRAPNLNRKVRAIDTNFFDRSDQNLRGIVCTVSAAEIVNLIRSTTDRNTVELGIFDQNVRVYLKKNNRINSRIIDSALSDSNHMFWYQNNGITITCDKYEVSPVRRSPEIEMVNAQIVNGGQTSNCLFEVGLQNPEKLEDILILLRIIETNDPDIKYSIAETTNSQTPINGRDLRSNDRIQKQFEDGFRDIEYFYERKLKQFEHEDPDVRVDALSAAQSYLAYSLGLPEVAKKDRGRIFGDLYDTVYTDDATVRKLLVCFQILKLIEEYKNVVRRKIRNQEELGFGEISIIDGAYHLIFSLGKILERKEIDLFDFENARQLIPNALRLIAEIYESEQQRDPNFSPNRFFKDAKTKDLIIRQLDGYL